MPMTTEFDRVERYNEELLSIKSQGSLITWYCEVSLKTRCVLSLLPQGL